MSYRDKRELRSIQDKDRYQLRKIRKKEWAASNTPKYCDRCFYSFIEDETEHANCLTTSTDSRRKQNPQMMKILKERKNARRSEAATNQN